MYTGGRRRFLLLDLPWRTSLDDPWIRALLPSHAPQTPCADFGSCSSEDNRVQVSSLQVVHDNSLNLDHPCTDLTLEGSGIF